MVFSLPELQQGWQMGLLRRSGQTLEIDSPVAAILNQRVLSVVQLYSKRWFEIISVSVEINLVCKFYSRHFLF